MPPESRWSRHMTLTKAQIVEAIAEQNGFPKSQSSAIVEILLEIIKGKRQDAISDLFPVLFEINLEERSRKARFSNDRIPIV